MISHEYLLTRLRYNTRTGVFVWLAGKKNLVGKPAGSVNNKGYHRIRIGRANYATHRLAWFYVTGDWPKSQIDHIDLNKLNNIFSNLRIATPSQNTYNQPLLSTNTSGIKGVVWHKSRRKWQAQIKCNGKCYYLGVYDDKREAAKARLQASEMHHGEFRRSE